MRQEFGFLLSAQHLKLCGPVLFDQDARCCSNTTSVTITTIDNKTKRSGAKWKDSAFTAVHLTCITFFIQGSMHMYFKFCSCGAQRHVM